MKRQRTITIEKEIDKKIEEDAKKRKRSFNFILNEILNNFYSKRK